MTATLHIRKIANGFIVSPQSANGLIGYPEGDPADHYYATQDDMEAAIPALVRIALQKADEQQKQVIERYRHANAQAGMGVRDASNRAYDVRDHPF